MDLSIITINYNTYQLTSNCITSVIKYTAGLTYEIILVDNHSTEEEFIPFEVLFPAIKVLRSNENLGFAGGNNLGIRHAAGKFVLLLNSDTYLEDNSVAKLWQYLVCHPKAAVVSGKLMYPDGRLQSACQRFPSVQYQLFEFLRLQKVLPKSLGGKVLLGSFFDHRINTVADWVWGTCFMFRKDLLCRLPGKQLDDRFFMYWEDVQWCWDFKQLGYEVHYCAEAYVVHLLGHSKGQKAKLMYENEERFLRDNYSLLHRVAIKGFARLLRAGRS